MYANRLDMTVHIYKAINMYKISSIRLFFW